MSCILCLKDAMVARAEGKRREVAATEAPKLLVLVR